MEIYVNPSRDQWARLCQRAVQDNEGILSRVREILEQVRQNGDEAIKDLTRRIDGVELDCLKVSEEEFSYAEKAVPENVKDAIRQAYRNIYAFHTAQKSLRVEVETAAGVRCIQKSVPIGRVGLYIPGGTAPLFSTVLMLAVPSQGRSGECGSAVHSAPVRHHRRVQGWRSTGYWGNGVWNAEHPQG